MRTVLLLLLLVPATAFGDYDTDLMCLAHNIYHEARSQPVAEKLAISHVVLNRVKHNSYPSTVCDVVYQARKSEGKIVLNKCQFSWYCDGKLDEPTNRAAWTESVRAATIASVIAFDITEGATHYHANYVDPNWASELHFTIAIGRHRFYR
jgi:N-acetylmuramoyl-L-alanine amidase|tara:strand:- start:1434 stop:1886 length:453 start_codon:yes stop_codon:yes gene_type:complete